MRNLELKARCADLERAEGIAVNLGAEFDGELHQLDTYFHVPAGRLKLRETVQRSSSGIAPLLASGGGVGVGAELIYYERAEDSATRWSDYFTAAVSSADSLRDVLGRALGIRQQVEKWRKLYWYRGARIHLDRVRHLGDFIEFEVPSADDEHAARQLMAELMQAFGIKDGDSVRASYGELIRADSS